MVDSLSWGRNVFIINGKDRAIFIYLDFKFSIMNDIEKGDSFVSPVKGILADLTVKDIERLRVYYVEEAERLMAFFGQEEEDALSFMKKHLRIVEALLRELRFPWEDCIPVLYSSFMHYIVLEEEKEKRKRLSNLMTELIKKMKFFAKKESLVMGVTHRFQEQRQEVEALIALRDNEFNTLRS